MAYEDNPPYELSRSTLRKKYGQRAIRSFGPTDSGGPGSMSARDPSTGFTRDDVWNSFFRTPPTWETTRPRMVDRFRPVAGGGTFINPQGNALPGVPKTGAQYGSSIVSPYGTASVRSANEVTAEAARAKFDQVPFNPMQRPANSATSAVDLAPAGPPVPMAGEDYLREVIRNAPTLPAMPELQSMANSIGALAAPSRWDVPLDESF